MSKNLCKKKTIVIYLSLDLLHYYWFVIRNSDYHNLKTILTSIGVSVNISD